MISLDLYTSTWEVVLRLVIAVAFGAVIGWERETKGRPAGLRTHMLVALGSVGLTIIAVELIERLTATRDQSAMDPLRIIEAIIGGVGFLCAGAIFQSRGTVKGLTTAAGIWVVAAVGVAAGLGHYLLAIIMTAVAVITLAVVRWVERLIPVNAEESQEAAEK